MPADPLLFPKREKIRAGIRRERAPHRDRRPGGSASLHGLGGEVNRNGGRDAHRATTADADRAAAVLRSTSSKRRSGLWNGPRQLQVRWSSPEERDQKGVDRYGVLNREGVSAREYC